jgi:hypothetical protein
MRKGRAASQPGSLCGLRHHGSRTASTVALLPTRDYGVSLRVPIFDGGRRDARRAETASQFRQERVRTNDLHEQVELEVRMALDSLHSAEEQVKVAKRDSRWPRASSRRRGRRYEAGVASSLEVTDAQTRLERARDNHIAALFNHNVARFDLGQATGTILEMVQREPSGETASASHDRAARPRKRRRQPRGRRRYPNCSLRRRRNCPFKHRQRKNRGSPGWKYMNQPYRRLIAQGILVVTTSAAVCHGAAGWFGTVSWAEALPPTGRIHSSACTRKCCTASRANTWKSRT